MEAEWPIERSGHVSVAIGKLVLVWGGYTDPPNPEQALDIYLPPDEVWLYNTEINKWMRHITSGDLPQGLSGAQAVYLSSERAVYVICGFMAYGHTNEVYRLDAVSWSWTRIEINENLAKPSPRDKFTAWEFEDRIYIFGGYGPAYHPYMHDNGTYFPDYSSQLGQSLKGWNNQLLIFSTESQTWSNPKCTGCVPSPRAAHGVARIGHEAFLFGGRHDDVRLNDLYSLNMVTLDWTQIIVTGDVPVGRSWHALTTVSDRRICLFGGYTTARETLGDAWCFDRVTLRWSLVSLSLLRPRLWHTAVCTSDENVVVFGGCSSDILSNAPTEHTNDLLVFRLSPKTLLQLCLNAVYSYKHLLEDQWSNLPRSLSFMLFARCSPPLLHQLS